MTTTTSPRHTETIEIVRNATLSLRDLDDIAITAVEGGIGYWALIDNDNEKCQTEEDADGTKIWYLGMPIYAFADDMDDYDRSIAKIAEGKYHDLASTWHRESDESDWLLVGRIDSAAIARGIKAILNADVTIREDLHRQVETILTGDPDIDADAADCIVQAGIFGKVVFG